MEASEFAAKHANDGKQVKVKNQVSATTLVNEVIAIKELVRIEKTKYGTSAWLIRIDDDTGFFSTKSMTKQIDNMVAEGVTPENICKARWLITKTHIDEHTDPKTGKHYDACDPLGIKYVEHIDEPEE